MPSTRHLPGRLIIIMRVRIITIGSEGDVRPYVALGVGLRKAGHDVRVATHTGFELLVREHGLDFAPVAGDPRKMADKPQLRALQDNGRSPLQWWKTFKEVDAPLMRQRLRDCWEACSDADAIVVSVLPCLFGYAIAKKLQIPLVRAFYFPTSPTRYYAADFVPSWAQSSPRFNLASFQFQRQVLWQVARPWIVSASREVLGFHGLPLGAPFQELDQSRQLILYCYSREVSPPPPDWQDFIDVTGYWFLDRETNWTPPPALSGFLESGPAPVYIGGFGSMTNREPAELARTVLDALAATGIRALVLRGWGGLEIGDLPANVFATEWVPFDWLFSQVAAAVHHGGAGTTAASLRAGIPTITVPSFLDQFYWSKRVSQLGAGPQPIMRKNLTAESLASALRIATSDTAMKTRAAELGRRIRSEDGVSRAVNKFNNHLRSGDIA